MFHIRYKSVPLPDVFTEYLHAAHDHVTLEVYSFRKAGQLQQILNIK